MPCETMKIYSSKYTGSYTKLAECPQPDLVEFAFIGRSNVGKSSLLNMLLDRKNLATTSKNPGHTQRLNFFLINDSFYFVDMPGYGYAKRSKKQRQKWHTIIHHYFRNRVNLACVFLLVDSRVPPQQSDLAMTETLGAFEVPFAILFTKIDQLKQKALHNKIRAFKEALGERFAFLPHTFATSASTKAGKDEILSFIHEVINEVKDQE